ncbi:hypothetical protein ACN47E_001383 [Coniothyrium glycines]
MDTHIDPEHTTAELQPPQSILTSRRLLVRPMRPQDSHSLAQYANNPRVSKYMSLSFPSPYTLVAAEDWISMNLKRPEQDNFVICEKSSPEIVIGGIGLKPGADVKAHTAEVGFWIGEPFWGQGLTTEALEAFTNWVFLQRHVKGTQTTRLCGDVFSGNFASMRCFEKCGYVSEGVLKGHCEKDGKVHDLHQYGILKKDWTKRLQNLQRLLISNASNDLTAVEVWP